MQTFGLHKNVYNLAHYACTQELLDQTIRERNKLLGDWETLKARKVPDKEIARITNISRATYYRRKKALRTLGIKGLKKKNTRPKSFRASKMPIETINRILAIRRENPTYRSMKVTR